MKKLEELKVSTMLFIRDSVCNECTKQFKLYCLVEMSRTLNVNTHLVLYLKIHLIFPTTNIAETRTTNRG